MSLSSTAIPMGELSDILQELAERAAQLYEVDPERLITISVPSEDDRTPQVVFFNLMLQLCDTIEEPQVRNYVRQFLEGL